MNDDPQTDLQKQLAAANAEIERLMKVCASNTRQYEHDMLALDADLVRQTSTLAARNAELEAMVVDMERMYRERHDACVKHAERLAAAEKMLKNTWAITLQQGDWIVLIDQVWGNGDGTAPNYFTLRRLEKGSTGSIEAMRDEHREPKRFKNQIDACLAAVAAGWIAAEQPQPKGE